MTGKRSFPIRVRLTIASLAGLLFVITGLSWFVYVRTNHNLLETVDAGLRSRSEVLAEELRASGPTLPTVRPTLIESDEGFAQLTDSAGKVVDSSAVVRDATLVPAEALAGLTSPTLFDQRVAGIDNITRVLAAPIDVRGKRFVLLVGTSLQDRRDEVLQLAATLAIAGGVLVVFIGAGAWWLIGAALEPVERMRSQAERITTAGPAARLAVADGADEIARLGLTLNDMLERIEAVVERERELVDRASHELRTPLAIQRVALDLALTGPQTVEELVTALRSVSEENEHLDRVAEDLLVLSRARGGALEISSREVSLAELVNDVVRRNRARAEASSVTLRAVAPQLNIHLDPDWMRQALNDLLDNAIRMTPPGGEITISGSVQDGRTVIAVTDTGPGFTEAAAARAFDPFTTGDGHRGAGLGLAIVRTIAEAHDGTVEITASDAGACVLVSLPAIGPRSR